MEVLGCGERRSGAKTDRKPVDGRQAADSTVARTGGLSKEREIKERDGIISNRYEAKITISHKSMIMNSWSIFRCRAENSFRTEKSLDKRC